MKFSKKHKQKPKHTYLSEIKGWGFWEERKVRWFVFNSGSFLGQDTDKPDPLIN